MNKISEWWRDFNYRHDDFVFGMKMILSLIIAAALIVGAAMILGRASCIASSNQLELEYRWTALGGCAVNAQGTWIPLDKYQYVVVPGGTK